MSVAESEMCVEKGIGVLNISKHVYLLALQPTLALANFVQFIRIFPDTENCDFSYPLHGLYIGATKNIENITSMTSMNKVIFKKPITREYNLLSWSRLRFLGIVFTKMEWGHSCRYFCQKIAPDTI